MYLGAMALQKLENATAFVVRDLDVDTPAIGIVRSAPKILQGGAKELARSQTYQLAILGMQLQGASCGVNASPEDRDATMASFCDELLPTVESGSLMIDAAKGVSASQLQPLSDADQRPGSRLADVDGIPFAAHLCGVGAVTCAQEARSLDGATIAIENFNDTGLAVARAASAAGAKITAVSTAQGAALSSDGFELEQLSQHYANDGAAMVASLSEEALPFWRVLGADVDVLFAGSKAGLIDHKNGENIKASTVVPTGPIPYTTKGALDLSRRDVVVLPDFVTTSGSLLAGFPSEGDDNVQTEAAVVSRLRELTASVLEGEDMPILQACYQAEAFLETWREELPFGRPFA